MEIKSGDFDEIIQHIRGGKPTRRMSVNDQPTTETYYRIQVDSTEGTYYYFVYMDHGQVYIEIPYEGIYETNQDFLGFIAGYKGE